MVKSRPLQEKEASVDATRRRRFLVTIGLVLLIIAVVGVALFLEQRSSQKEVTSSDQQGPVAEALLQLPVKGKAPKTGYSRQQFSDGWGTDGASGCSVRNVILQRDLTNTQVRQTSEGRCNVVKGQLQDPYTGKQVTFDKTAGDAKTAAARVQIDHVVALSNAWQTGAQEISKERRRELANDPLNLLAVDGQANQQRSDADASGWLPPNKAFRCQYVARQVAVKRRYSLWVTAAERQAMLAVLRDNSCQQQQLPN